MVRVASRVLPVSDHLFESAAWRAISDGLKNLYA